MNENKGAAELLRGIIGEYEANDGQICSAMVKVLDADGVPIEVGDTVYCDDDPEQLIVDSFDDPGCVYLTLAKSPDGVLYTIEPSRLSHEFHDSWERIADELEGAEKWCDQNGVYDTGFVSITESKLREWSDRIRKLAKR